jgi:hypothetical protein
MGESTIARWTVTGCLRDSDTQKIKSFSFRGVGFDPKTFPLLADFIDRGKIKVEYQDDLSGSAAYDYKLNTIFLGFTWAIDEVKKALIIHESTHALYDVVQQKMTTAVSESIAYIVQCQYAYIKMGANKRLSSPNAAKDLVFKLAWDIAVGLQNGKAPSQTDIGNLEGAVSQHPLYMAKSAGDAGFDGV